ncbi:MAG: SCO7613 C-terminal domain-containing membrane protein [Oscillochloridaceae bacterium umkhey_bin13]
MFAIILLAALIVMILALIGFFFIINWFVVRLSPPNQSTKPQAPASSPTNQAEASRFAHLVSRWQAEGQLTPEVAAQVQALLAAEYQRQSGMPGQSTVDDAPLPAAPPPGMAAAPDPGAAFSAASAAPTEVRVTPQLPVPPGVPAPPSSLAAPSALDANALPASPTPAPFDQQVSVPTWAPTTDLPHKGGAQDAASDAVESPVRHAPRSLGAALLALGTRRTLLFLGAFLLVMSSLTLVIFSWATLPPLLQLAIIAGTSAILWGCGSWMTRQPDLGTAGRNLQLVAALLVPVIGFALGRPGLLDLATVDAWRLSSGLSLLAYTVAAWRSGRVFYSGAAAAMALSLSFALLNPWLLAWQLAAALLISAALLPVARWLNHTAQPVLAAGPRWVALIAGSLLVFVALPVAFIPPLVLAQSVALFAGALFLGSAYWHEQRKPWLWLALTMPAMALLVLLLALKVTSPVFALSFALAALAYLGLSLWAEQWHLPAAPPSLLGALLLGGFAFTSANLDGSSVRLALPVLVLLAATLPVMVERGRMAWTGAFRILLAASGLFGAGFLATWWFVGMLDLTNLKMGVQGLLVLPLAALALVAAHWWPGRLHPAYDRVLQGLGALITLGGWLFALLGDQGQLASLLITLIIGAYALLRERWWWATFALVAASTTVVVTLGEWPWEQQRSAMPLAYTALAALYSLGGAALRQQRLRYWTRSGIILGAWLGFIGLSSSLLLPASNLVLTVILLSLAATFAGHTMLWRQPLFGYAVASLFALGVLLSASEGFFIGWTLAPGALAYLVCALALGLAVLDHGLRRFGPVYGHPYAVVALVLLTAAPLAALPSTQALTLTFSAMVGLYGLALWRYRLPGLLGAAFISMDLALLHGAAWLLPGGNPAGAGLIIASAVIVQSLFSAWTRRTSGLLARSSRWGYAAAGVGGLGALALAFTSQPHLAAVSGLLAALLLLLTWLEQQEALAWGSLGLGLLGGWLALLEVGLTGAWAAAWLILALVGVALVGWLATRRGLVSYRRASSLGALLAAGLLLFVVAASSLIMAELAALTFALANLGLLLATLAVRERSLNYAYAAGAVFVGAILCQFADWGLRELQWYVVPAGVYLFVLADGLRRFQGRKRASQLIETVAVLLLLGVTFVQAVRPDGTPFHTLGLFGESLLVVAYGALARLRIPFTGGLGSFVLGVLWMVVDSVRLVNQWVLLGLVGLLMVIAYVILERHQERLVRTGRRWADALQHWG